MAVDTSMYGNVQVPQVNMPSPVDTATKAITLKQLGMQNQALQYQRLQQQQQFAAAQAVRQAYSDNTDQNGNLNRQGFLSDLGKKPYAASQVPGYQKQFAENDKAQAEAKQQQVETAQKILSITEPALEHLASMPEDQRSAAYHGVMKQVAAQGVPMDQVPPEYDPAWFRQAYQTAKQSKDYLANQLTAAQTQKTQTENQQVGVSKGAEELSKFNEDVNNPSSRKITGSLTDTINRADRIQALANVGAKPNETDQEKIARLNNVTPQLAQEFSASLASIMNGGVPPEELQRKLAPDTIQASLANLQQKFTAEPTPANQGALLKGYVDAAKQLGDFSRSRLQQIKDQAAAAYPYAQKYFPDRMEKIAAPLAAPKSPSEPAGSQKQVASSGSTTPEGMIKMRGPDGKSRWIPKAMKGEAIAAGGEVVN